MFCVRVMLRDAVDEMDVDDKAGLVVFGAEAATEVVPSPRPPLGTARASVPRDATNIGAAIRRALADLPAEHVGRIVLISDGVETDGDALAAAASAASRGSALSTTTSSTSAIASNSSMISTQAPASPIRPAGGTISAKRQGAPGSDFSIAIDPDAGTTSLAAAFLAGLATLAKQHDFHVLFDEFYLEFAEGATPAHALSPRRGIHADVDDLRVPRPALGPLRGHRRLGGRCGRPDWFGRSGRCGRLR